MKKFIVFFACFLLLGGAVNAHAQLVNGELTVDYSQSLEKMIKAAEFCLADNFISSEYYPILVCPIKKIVKVHVQLFKFPEDISHENALASLDKAGYRAATLPELLALAAAAPELQRGAPIIALGSAIHIVISDDQSDPDNMHLYAPVLDDRLCGRILTTEYYFDQRWFKGLYFLAIKK